MSYLKLLLPLKYYDAAGRVIPSVGFYLCLLFLSRSLLIFIASISVRENSDILLRLFYPEVKHLYVSLSVGFPALLVWVIVGFREKIWASNKVWLFKVIKPLIIVSIIGDLIFHFLLAKLQHWQFSWVISLTTFLGMLCLYFIIKDNHIKLMLVDWKKG